MAEYESNPTPGGMPSADMDYSIFPDDNTITYYPQDQSAAQDHVSYTNPQQPGMYYTSPQQPAYPAPEMIAYQGAAVSQQNRDKFVMEKNHGFLKTAAGIMNIVNIVLLFIAWVIMVGWRGHNGSIFVFVHQHDGSSFFFVATLFPFFLLIAYLVVVVTGFYKRIERILNLQITIVLLCALFAILLTASSSMVIRVEENKHCSSAECAIAESAAAFGLFSALGLLVEGIYYFKKWKDGNSVHLL